MVIRNIKRIGSMAAVSFWMVSAAHAVGAGFYMGGQLGKSELNNGPQTLQAKNSSSTEVVSPSNTGLGARIYMGYNFNKYAALESGFTYYSPSSYNGTNASGKIHASGLDILAKGTWPIFTTGVDVFAKAGLAIIGTNVSSTIVSNTLKKGYALPTIGAGVSYDISQQWVADLTYMTVPKRSSYPGASTTMLGISYHFVDVYCGQFLC